jgi:hypothetical protein
MKTSCMLGLAPPSDATAGTAGELLPALVSPSLWGLDGTWCVPLKLTCASLLSTCWYVLSTREPIGIGRDLPDGGSANPASVLFPPP